MRKELSLTAITNRLLMDVGFCSKVGNRIAAAERLVNALPRSAPLIRKLLRARPHRLSYEVQYSILNFLDGGASFEGIQKLFGAAQVYLDQLDSNTAFVGMKTGCMFGDGWFCECDERWRSKILTLLILTLERGRSRFAREAALHGLEHVLNEIDVRRGKTLLDQVNRAATSDRSKHVRIRARMILKHGWWGQGGHHSLKTYSRKIGAKL